MKVKKIMAAYMIRVSILTLIIIFSASTLLFGESTGDTVPKDSSTLIPSQVNPDKKKDSNKKLQDILKNIKVDTRLMYGLYHNLYTYFSILRNYKDFTYQLNSELKRSHDFGHDNSAYHEGEIGFTGKSEFAKHWELLPKIEIKNESHGMFSNATYSRENKDIILGHLKFEYKPAPHKVFFMFGGGSYSHTLVGSPSINTNFVKITEEIMWENIISQSNKIFYKHTFISYLYYGNSSSFDYDLYTKNELFMSFKIAEYLQIAISLYLDWDLDYTETNLVIPLKTIVGFFGVNSLDELAWFPKGLFLSGKINLALVGIKWFSSQVYYTYDLKPFKPEKTYFQHKFINPQYDLPPGVAHDVNLEGKFNWRFKSKKENYLKDLVVKFKAIYQNNNNYYNFYPIGQGLISATTIPVHIFKGTAEIITGFMINKKDKLKFSISYNVQYFHNENNLNITYKPMHTLEVKFRYSNKTWDFSLNHKYFTAFYYDPSSSSTLSGAVIADFELQYKLPYIFNLYLKVNNLYNMQYTMREGYHDPGVVVLAGIRIVI